MSNSEWSEEFNVWKGTANIQMWNTRVYSTYKLHTCNYVLDISLVD